MVIHFLILYTLYLWVRKWLSVTLVKRVSKPLYTCLIVYDYPVLSNIQHIIRNVSMHSARIPVSVARAYRAP